MILDIYTPTRTAILKSKICVHKKINYRTLENKIIKEELKLYKLQKQRDKAERERNKQRRNLSKLKSYIAKAKSNIFTSTLKNY